MNFLKKVFNRKHSQPSFDSYEAVGLDLHSHLLPGIDDGVETVAEGVSIVKRLHALGYSHIITTPHTFQEYYPNTSDIIKKKEAIMQAAINEAGIPVTFQAASEYYLDNHFLELLKAKDILTLGTSRRVLVETSMMLAEPRLHEFIFQIKTAGYQPVLAHPERYAYYDNPADKMLEVKNWGCELQLNISSLTGRYGTPIQKIADKLLRAGAYDFVGTDIHRMEHVDLLSQGLAQKSVQHLLSIADTFKNKILL